MQPAEANIEDASEAKGVSVEFDPPISLNHSSKATVLCLSHNFKNSLFFNYHKSVLFFTDAREGLFHPDPPKTRL